MTIGIIGAMDEEIELLKQKMTDVQEIEVANTSFYQGYLEGKEVVLLLSGIGKVNAAMSTTILHERFKPDKIINTGSAGGFAENLEVGDVVISTEVLHHDVDATAFDYVYGQVPGMPAVYTASPDLIELADKVVLESDIQAETGIIATGDSFMQRKDQTAVVQKRFPEMLALEMEAAAIAQVCYQYKTPFVIIRALSDIAGKESSVSFDVFLEKAAKNAADVIIKMVQKL
ncbi:5'-methylthioadenosine/S-adenosylhomocysteine nucleosidase [Oceanobacillus timonensis]|uniref:5'-methylthioadenosine/S-adenosylhomocysteine nucleosidase n=1 Tax=Oceanobacillus timonensis TaxID=1926285 RepID=UPI00117C1779|nr:5'-methylthioadenosine/S-adenosylhomocysteine nucleosidase [Oceanobacillus timonensis]